jgi:UDP-glucose 4-epimerase
MENKKNVLVTGGAGFVGSRLVKKLQELGNNVFVVDNLSYGSKNNFHEGVQYFIEHTKNIAELKLPKLDLIFHLGEYSKVTPSFAEIDKVFDLNIEGSFSIFEYCRKHQIPVIYSASSTRLAAEGDGHSPYSFFKSMVVQLLKNYSIWYNLNYSICYFYNVYGPSQYNCDTGWETVINIFEKKMRANKSLTIVGDGLQRRDFTYVEDIVDGLILASGKLENDEYQLGSGQDYSILEVAKMFGGDIVHIEERLGDRKYGLANVNETYEKLNWRPKMTLQKWIHDIKLSFEEEKEKNKNSILSEGE